MVKRTVDVVCATFGIVVAAPVLAIVSVLILLDDGAPVFYRGVRVGRNGCLFRLLKFRTMVVNADRIGGPSTSTDDPRVTRIGRTLRRYKLDELPQLANVLVGEMSFVGPRPEVEEEVRLYTEEERALLTVKPGITDYASIRFHDEGDLLKGAADPHEAYRRLVRPEKLRLGLEYVRHRTWNTDLKIFVLTIATLIGTRLLGSAVGHESSQR